MFNLLNDITNISQEIDFTLKIELQPLQYNIPILVFQKGIIRLVVVTGDKKDNSFIKEKLINLNQAVRLIRSQEFKLITVEFIYRKNIYRTSYYAKDLSKFQKELKEFIEKIKDETLKSI